MKILKYSLFALLLVAGSIACTPGNQKDAAKINAAEEELFAENDGFIDRTKAMEIVDLYEAYANNYPEDSMAVEYIFKGAEFCLNLGAGDRAIALYDRVIKDYPDFRKAPECLFLKGYVYENYLGDLENARVIYTEFIEKYPDNEFADDAEISIQNLGKTPEELIQQFEQSETLEQ